MRIEEMRPGIRFSGNEIEDQAHEAENAAAIRSEPPFDAPADAATEPSSELSEPIWAVISFSKTEASGLSYPQAAELMAELDARCVAGLCIVSQESANRVGS